MFIASGDDRLLAVHTAPASERATAGVVMVSGGGVPMTMGVNRLWVRLSRELADRGFHSARFDYHGVGESTGRVDEIRLDRPFTGDLQSVTTWLQQRGVEELALVGTCFGARTALACAAADIRIRDLVLLAAPVRDFKMGERSATRFAVQMSAGQYLRRGLRGRTIRLLADPRTRKAYAKIAKTGARAVLTGARRDARRGPDGWVSRGFLDQLEATLDRGARVLLVQGSNDDFWEETQLAMEGRLGRLAERAEGRLRIETVEGELHGFPSMSGQDAAADLVLRWLSRTPFSESLVSNGEVRWTSR